MALVARTAPFLLLVGLVACSVHTTASSPGRTTRLNRTVLSNGVRIVVQEYPESAVVALQLWVKAGGRDEADNELGLAHYLEHMLFKGTTTRAAGLIERDVEGVGGRMNAGTSWDYTYYHMVLPASRALAGIDTLADISVNATLDAALLDAEKQVVLEEMRRGEDDPRTQLGRRLHAVLLEGHPYGRPIIGTAELIRALTRETLASFYRRHYAPEAFTLVVVGAVDSASVVDAAARVFGRLPRAATSRFLAVPPTLTALKRAEVERPGAYAYLGLAWSAARLDHADTPALELLASILGQSRTSRLTRSLRENLSLVNSIRMGYSAMEGAGLLTVTAQLDPANLGAAEREIREEIRRVREHGVTEAELRRAATAVEARERFSKETAEGRAFALGRAETIWRLEEELAYLDRVRAVTREQLQTAARRYLDPERYARVALVPPPR